MERYGKFFGCDKTGRYEALKASSGLSQFLIRCGAKNAGAAMDAITQTVCRFKRFDKYYENPQDDYPVSLCYVPMHLYRKEAFQEMTEPVYSVTVNGNENKARDTVYACCAIVSRKEMLEGDTFNHLDHIFGTPLITWQDMYRLREERQDLDYSMTPVKVTPVLKKSDLNAVCSVVEAIYAGKKNICICTENGFNFNKRSLDFLMQVYSLLPPRLAVEIGFVTYQPRDVVEMLAESAGVRISVVPGEAAATLPAADENTFALDLNNAKVESKGKVYKCAMWWSNLSWDQRREAMKALFADRTINIIDAEKYVEITAAFSGSDFLNGRLNDKRFENVEQLREFYENDPVLSKNIGWVTAQFREFAAKRLPSGVKLNTLKGQALANVKLAELEGDSAAAKKYSDQYQFISKLEAGDSGKSALKYAEAGITAAAKRQAEVEVNAARAALYKEQQAREADRQEHAQQMEAARGAHARELQEYKLRTAAEVDQLKQTHQEEKLGLEAAVATEQAKLRRTVEEAKRKIEAVQGDCEAKMQELKVQQHNEKANLIQKLQDAKSAIEKMQETHATEKARLESEHQIELASERKKSAHLAAKLRETGGEVDIDVYEDQEPETKSGGKFDKPMGMKELIISAVAGLAVGVVLMTIIFFIVGAITGGDEPAPTETDGPSITTQADETGETGETGETTAPTETTAPPETTVPPETTLPPETTEPEETTNPEDVERMEIDWTTAPEEAGLTAAETDAEKAGALLEMFDLGENVTLEAIVTVAEKGFADEDGDLVLPEQYAVVLRKGAAEENNPDGGIPFAPPAKLEDKASLILENTWYRLVIVGDEQMQTAALKLFALATADTDPGVTMDLALAEDKVLALGELMGATMENEPWWQGIKYVTCDESEMLGGKALLGSARVPVAAVVYETTTVYIYDYTDDLEKGNTYVNMQLTREEPRRAAIVDGYVAIEFVLPAPVEE